VETIGKELPMRDVSELIELVALHFPGATIGEDNDGQIVIYTDLAETPDGWIVPYEPAE
jgi:hypothetical protein